MVLVAVAGVVPSPVLRLFLLLLLLVVLFLELWLVTKLLSNHIVIQSDHAIDIVAIDT